MIDIGSRRLLGYSMADHMRAELVTTALQAAVHVRGGHTAGVVFHSDHGAQYTPPPSPLHATRPASTSRWAAIGSSADNALAEFWFATLKRELLHRRPWATEREARQDVLRWIAFYNHRRRHSALGMLSPIDYENRSTPAGTSTCPNLDSSPGPT